MAKLGRPPGAYTQYRRLSQLREMLESHPKGLSLVEIGQRLHVTERSVRRYLRELEREVDVERMPHPDGLGGVVVKIPTRDLPRRVKLHRTQIYGLLMARRVFKMLEGTTFEHTLRDAVDQLLAHVQRSPRRGAALDPDTRLEDRFLYLPATPMKPLVDDAAEVLDTMLDACAQLRECVIKYRKAKAPPGLKAKDGVETLHVHPYAVVLYKDAIYCVCFVKERSAVRTLRMDRFVDADASPVSHFALPDGFSVDRHFAGAFGVHAGDAPTRVVIDFHSSVADYVQSRQFPGEDAGSAIVEPLEDGGVRLRMVVGATTEVRSWVMSFGDKARVVEPAELADGITAELRGALALYDQPTGAKRATSIVKKPRPASRAR
ncbi:MAG: WYL domain-containing transcriptional regulator [Polyangiales bacterium]